MKSERESQRDAPLQWNKGKINLQLYSRDAMVAELILSRIDHQDHIASGTAIPIPPRCSFSITCGHSVMKSGKPAKVSQR